MAAPKAGATGSDAVPLRSALTDEQEVAHASMRASSYSYANLGAVAEDILRQSISHLDVVQYHHATGGCHRHVYRRYHLHHRRQQQARAGR